MTDILEKAILISLGLEERIKDALNKLANPARGHALSKIA
jgi:hypothetical protein